MADNPRDELEEYKLRDASHRRAAQEKEDYIQRLIEAHLQTVKDLEAKVIQYRMEASILTAKVARLEGPATPDLGKLELQVAALQEDSDFLAILRGHGVDNWGGYGDAQEEMWPEEDD